MTGLSVVSCAFCGELAQKTGRWQLYCSARCKGRAKERRKQEKERKPFVSRVCPECQARFDTNRARQGFCSKLCGNRARDRERELERVYPSTARPPVERPCEECRQPFQVGGKNLDTRRFCSRVCAVRSRRRKDPSVAASGADHRRRARDGGVVYEPGLTWHRLVAEDGLACWLCGEDVDPADKAPSGGGWAIGRRYPTVDHVVPMARGGHHVRGNVRLAHLVCNSARGISVVGVPVLLVRSA